MRPLRNHYVTTCLCLFNETLGAPQDCAHHNFTRSDGTRYLGGFIGLANRRAEWLRPQIEEWAEGVRRLARVARRFPQTAFAGLSKSLQAEWQYALRVLPEVQRAFGPVEDALANDFLPALFDVDPAEIRERRDLLALPVKAGGIGVPDPTSTGTLSHATSLAVTDHLTDALMPDGPDFDLEAYIAEGNAARKHFRNMRVADADADIDARIAKAPKLVARRLGRSKDCGGWLSLLPRSLHGTALDPDSLRDSIRIRYGIKPSDLPAKCDGCGAKYDVAHALSCKKGGQVLARHDDLKHEWRTLCTQAVGKSNVFDEPSLKTSQDVRDAGAKQHAEPDEELRGDIAVHGFWKSGNCGIFDVRVTDTDAPYQLDVPPEDCLARHEKEKKKRYLRHCLDRKRSFTPLVFSVDGLLSRECTAAMRRLATLLAAKWSSPYSQVCGFVRARLVLALIRANSRCLRAERNPIWRAQRPAWEAGDGLCLVT